MAKYSLIKTAKIKNKPGAKPEDLIWYSVDHHKRPISIRLGSASEEELKMIFHKSPDMRLFIDGEVDPTYQLPGPPPGVVKKPVVESGKK